MSYYLVKDVDKAGVSIAVIRAESDEALIPVLRIMGVNPSAEIHHIETLEYDPLGCHLVYEKEFEVNHG